MFASFRIHYTFLWANVSRWMLSMHELFNQPSTFNFLAAFCYVNVLFRSVNK